MHTDQEVLVALQAHLDRDQLAAALKRLLRVPEAWAALHIPAFLDEVTASNPPAHLTSSHLASLALGGSLHSEMNRSIAEAHGARARQVWDEAAVGVLIRRDLLDTALLGVEFGRRYDDDPELLIERVSESAATWRSPIAIIWTNLENPEQLISNLLDQNMSNFAIQIALANVSASEAAALLTRNANGSTGKLLQQISRNRETELARSLSFSANGGSDRVSNLLIEAVERQFNGEPSAARSSLNKAWETASETAARIADITADQARDSGDVVTELEANRRALEIIPTPVRRARTALSLISLDRQGESLSLVSGTDPTVEEQIAAGLAQSQSGDSRVMLNGALDSISDPLDEEWLALLTEGLTSANDWAAAVRAARMRVSHHPASMEAYVSLARALFEAGDAEEAEEFAAIGIALHPDYEAARKLLAEIQHQIGHHTKALEHMHQLSAKDSSEFAQYAIAAGDLEMASNITDELPASSSKSFLEGQLLDRTGDHQGAVSKYREAVRRSPSEIRAYEALAAVHTERGSSAEAYDTLTEGIQANPKNPSIRLSLARHLREQGRVSEALDVSSAAWELDNTNVEAGLEYAELLSELGHADQAFEILRRLALRQPLSWRVGLALAKAFERQGDLAQAAQVIRPLPSTAPAEAYFHSARIAIRSGVKDSELDSALVSLEIAEQGGWANPSTSYWFGRAYEQAERYDEALARYKQALESNEYELREKAILGSARSALGMNQISIALAILEDAQAHYPRSARILAAMSDVYLFANLPDKALEVAEQAVELDPDDSRAWHALGDSLANSGDFRGAIKAVERLSALDPRAAEGWLTLARLASEAQDQRVVRRSVAEALWRGRRNPKVLQDTAQFLEHRGDLHSAIRVMKAATRTRPDDPQLLGVLASIQEAAADYQGAYKSWQANTGLAPSEPEPLRRSAACAQLLGLGSQSVNQLEKAVAIEPGNPWLRRDLARAHLEQGQVREGLLAYAGAVKAAGNDSSLAYEAAETALISGEPRNALGLLRSTLADSGRGKAAIGEAFLLLDKRDLATSSLSEAIELGYETPRSFAMLAVATSDRSRTMEFLERARIIQIESAHDAIWVARAEMGLFNAQQAVAALVGWDADPFAAMEQVRVSLRARDMLSLFSLSDAVSELQIDDLTSSVRSAMEALQKRNLEDPAFGPWLRVEEAPAELLDFIGSDPMGWIGEAITVALLKANGLTAASDTLAQVELVRAEAEWSSILKGMIHELAGQQEEARSAYRSGISSTPIASYLLGRAYERSESLERAATHMGAAVLEAPHQHRWQHRLASVYVQMGDEDSALAHFQEAVSSAPENSDYLLSLASAYASSGHLNQALEGYTAALAYGSDSFTAHREAGQVALHLEAYDQASTWFERAITLAPSDIDSLIGSAKASMALGNRQQADERLMSATQQAPDDARVLLGAGYVRAGSGDYEAALSAFEKALQAGADPIDVRRGESMVLIRQGKHDQASEAMEEVLNSDPDDHRLWHELAETLEAGLDLSSAEKAIGEAIRISPVNPEYRLGLGRISRKSGNLDRAVEELRKAENADPDDARIPVEAGLVYEDRREYPRALDSYLKAVEIDPNSLQAHYRAGLLLRTLKAYRKAGEMLKRAAELAPANQEVMHQLAAARALELVHG
ncbi:MAG: tetratricopeptide repeat protein [Anaerolineales bacterium]